MPEIECLGCGEVLALPDCIDRDNYDGQIVCQKCECLLHIKLAKEKLQRYELVERSARHLIYHTEQIMNGDEVLEERRITESTREKRRRESQSR